MRLAVAALAALSLSAGNTAAAALHNPWTEVTAPAAGPVHIIGSYAGGCIQGAQSILPDEGTYAIMRKSRRRYYAHPELRAVLKRIAREVLRRGWGKLLVGDIGQPRGGPATGGHASHQIGLDVDIWYWLDSPAVHRSLSDRDEEELGAVSMLNRAHTAVDPKHFDAKEVDLLHYVAEQPEVQRILVNPAIKKALCARTHQAAWLRKVRPWWGHTYHFHMRLACPPDQKQCRPQAAPPPGPGCGADLAWWFSAQAAEQARKNAAAARRITPAQALAKKLARVPKACRAVLASAPK